MTRTSTQAIKTRDIERIRRRVEHWRRTRVKIRPMPEELWEAAATVARKHGVNCVANELKLNHTSLSKRVRAGKGDDDGNGFVEVDLVGGAVSQAVVELTDESGAQMTIRTVGDGGVDVMGLAREFWSRGR